MRHLLLYWLPLLIVALFILYMSTLPGSDLPPLFDNADKILHFLGYALLGSLLWRALRSIGMRRAMLNTVLLSAIYGAFLEIIQMGIDGRGASFLDEIANSLGALAGCVVIRWVHTMIGRIDSPCLKRGAWAQRHEK